jgi:hypothetical protein
MWRRGNQSRHGSNPESPSESDGEQFESGRRCARAESDSKADVLETERRERWGGKSPRDAEARERCGDQCDAGPYDSAREAVVAGFIAGHRIRIEVMEADGSQAQQCDHGKSREAPTCEPGPNHRHT